ncbi:MAG: hypothetical protein VXW22_16295, partial [Pseudomonadota bacterium]|nr:hypothetical protein [Pseudomonadota bacterium]
MKHRLLAGAIITVALAACAPAIVETETDTNADVEAESSFEAQVGEILSAAYADDGPGVAVIITKDKFEISRENDGWRKVKRKKFHGEETRRPPGVLPEFWNK